MKSFWLGCIGFGYTFRINRFLRLRHNFHTERTITGWVVRIGERNGGHPCGF